MKILFVSRRGPTKNGRKGGAQEYILQLAMHVQKQGAETLILCGGEKIGNDFLPGNEVLNNVKIKRLKSSSSSALLKEALQMQNDFDVIVENIMAFALNIPKYLKNNKPFFAIRHHLQKKNFFKLQGYIKGLAGLYFEHVTEPYIYRNTHFIAASQLTASDMEKRWKRPKKVSVISPGYDFLEVNDVQQSNTPLIFFVGHLVTARKKVDDLILAFKDVYHQYPTAQLIIGGDGPDKSELMQMAKGMSCTFTGFLSDKEKHALYKRCWIFASPSVSEGFGITWIEANAHSRPVVGYELGLDTVNESCATMVKQGDIIALTKAINDLISNDTLRHSKQQGALQNAQRFSWENSAKKFLSLIDKYETD